MKRPRVTTVSKVRMDEGFGTELRRLRLAAGFSQERLAERSGISSNGVAALEAGRRKEPRLHTVSLLAEALGLDPETRAHLLSLARLRNDQQTTSSIAQPGSSDRPSDVATVAIEIGKHAEALRPSLFDNTLVGRGSEQRVLHNAWNTKTRVVLISGEAGVGKSTLAESFSSELAAQGVTVLRGKATQQQLGAYEAFIEPVRSAVSQFDGAIPSQLLELGRMIPGIIDESSTNVIVPSRNDAVVDRRVLFETVTKLLTSLGPTVVVLDDLHWSGPGTLALLAFLAAHPELSDVMFIGTIRSTDVTTTTSASLAELRRHCTLVRIQLDGLGPQDLASLVKSIAGDSASKSLIDTVTTATNGNPLYIKELTEHLLQTSFVDSDGLPREFADTKPNLPNPAGALTVPDGIRDTIEMRVSGLSIQAQALLRGGSVLGNTFELSTAGGLVDLAGETLLTAAEDALLSGLLVDQSATTVAFSHGLVSTTIYKGMSQARRHVLHRAAATVLAERSNTTAAEIVQVARHWEVVAEADPKARTEAGQWSVLAGDAASRSAAIDEAIDCYRRAAFFFEGPTAEHADALVRFGSALSAAGRIEEGKEQLQKAFTIADLCREPTVLARAALGLSASVRYGYAEVDRVQELELAISRMDPSEKVLRPALLATLRRQLGFVNTAEADERRIIAAAAVLEAVSSPEVSEDLLVSLAGLRDSLVVDDPIPLSNLAKKIIHVSRARQDLPGLSTGLYRLAWSSFELGQYKTFHEAINDYRSCAERMGRPYELALSSNMLAALAQVEGRFAAAEDLGQEALSHAAKISDGNFSWVYFANSGLRAVDQGRVQDTFQVLSASRDGFTGLPTFEAAFAAIAACAGELELAVKLTNEHLGSDGQLLDQTWSYLSAERLPVVGMLAWGCSYTANVEQAGVLRPRLQRIADLGVRVVRIAPVGAWIGPLDHHIGVLERVLNNLDTAEKHLRQALLVEEEMRGRPCRIRTLLELEKVTVLRNGGSRTAESSKFRTEAEALASKLGLETIVERESRG